MSSDRQLVAIMFTDIFGYSSLMGENAKKALESVRISKEIQKPLVNKHNGIWLKEMGDGVMTQFNTALDAVNCAVEIQQKCRVVFDGKLRIGIHLGDVTIEKGDIYGAGVNIASRLESIADPGGIYISESIERAIKGQNQIDSLYLGEIKLKNISYPLRTYALQGFGLPTPSILESDRSYKNFIEKFNSRGLSRILIVYFLVLWVLFELRPLTDELSLIETFGSFSLIIVFTISMPVALILAWKFERSPDGLIRTSSIQSAQNPYTIRLKKPLTSDSVLTFLLIAAVTASILNSYFFNVSGKINQQKLETSIAVIPFRNLSDNNEQGYIAAMTAELIRDKLSKLKDIRVISMTSTEQYKNETKLAHEIGEDLNVTHILEGSIFKYDDKLRLVIQLIDTETDSHVWSDSYDRDSKDILELQNEIANRVAIELKSNLELTEGNFLNKLVHLSPIDFDLYLKGIGLMEKFMFGSGVDSTALENAIDIFSKTIVNNPQFAEAYVSLANGLYMQGYYRKTTDDSQLEDTTLYLVNKALSIDQECIDCYLYLANYFDSRGGNDEDMAVKYYKKIIELDPNNNQVKSTLGYYYLKNKEFEKAVPLIIESIKGDPLNSQQTSGQYSTRVDYYDNLYVLLVSMGMIEDAIIIWKKLMDLQTGSAFNNSLDDMAFAYRLSGDFDSSHYYYNKAYLLDTNSMWYRNQLAESFLLLGNWEQANKYYLKSLKEIENDSLYFENSPSFFHRYGYVLWQVGDSIAAREAFKNHFDIIGRVVDEGSPFLGHLYDLAITHAFLGNKKIAYDLLRKIPYW